MRLYAAVIKLNRHRPSGLMSFIMACFIVAYVVIMKMDSETKVVAEQKHSDNKGHVVKVIRTTDRIIPVEILDEFEQDNISEYKGRNRTAMLEKVKHLTEDTTDIATDFQSENELILNSVLENSEEDIDKRWNSYLDKNNNAPKHKKKTRDHLSFQMINTPNKKLQQKSRIKLPKTVQVFDAMSESKKLRNSVNSNKCVLLKTLHGDSPICIHDPEYDLISEHIQSQGSWEPNYLYITGIVLKLDSELMFLDLGCNIGVYTILAANLGANVVAVDPNKANLRLLTKSLSLGKTRDKVTLLWNAISDVHENVTLNTIVGNVGGTYVSSSNEKSPYSIGDNTESITIKLDDLIGLFGENPVFIKMDIETYELKALQGGKRFFKEVNVDYVLMEWIAHRGDDTGQEIIDFMKNYDMYPHVNAHHNTKLDNDNYHSWPDNVLWIKYYTGDKSII